MADISDVSQAITALIDSIVYPTGDANVPASGYATQIAPGWPIPADLDAWLAAGKVYISVYPEQFERVTTRFERLWTSAVVVAATISIAAARQTITIGGTVTVGHYVSAVVLNVAASYAAKGGDTLATIAAALTAQLVAGGLSATASGPAITIPNADVTDIAVGSGAPGTMIQEVRRQQKSFMITNWAPTPEARDATASLIDPVLAATDYVGPFPDTTQGWLLYRNSNDFDESEKRNLYRRDLCYWVEYATTRSAPAYPITIFASTINVVDGTVGGANFVENSG